MREKTMTKWITYFEKFLLWFDCFYPYPPPRNPAPRNLFFSDCNVAVGTRGEKCTGGCGERVAGGGGIKYYFYCHSLFFSPTFFCVCFCPCNCNSWVHTQWAFVPYSQRMVWSLVHFLVFPESLELVGRPWLASVWFLKAQEGLSTSHILPLILVHVVSAFLRPARGNQRPGFK